MSPIPRDAIAALLPGMTLPDHPYPVALPEPLPAWHCYTVDGGHCVVVALAAYFRPNRDPGEFLVAAPVKAVLRAGWRAEAGYVVCDLPYDPGLGALTEPDDDEFDDPVKPVPFEDGPFS